MAIACSMAKGASSPAVAYNEWAAGKATHSIELSEFATLFTRDWN